MARWNSCRASRRAWAAGCWPDRLIGELPNIYLYAANNPSEATLAKRRSNAITITHLTPPLAQAGLYKGLQELKDSLTRWRVTGPRCARTRRHRGTDREQAEAVDLGGSAPDQLWIKLLETADALIPDGFHVLGRPVTGAAMEAYLDILAPNDPVKREDYAKKLAQDTEIPALLRALSGHFIEPVPGGDLIRSPDILPTGRNIHAFDPFRMPTAFALRDGAKQAQRLLDSASDPAALGRAGAVGVATTSSPTAARSRRRWR